MAIEFDPGKDVINRQRHGVSLARAVDLEILGFVVDDRKDYGEVRYRAFGLIGGEAFCVVFTPRGSSQRIISLRRAHAKEMKRHGFQP